MARRRPKCSTCGWPQRDGLCLPKPLPRRRHLTDKEAAKVVLPPLRRGTGKMKNPKVEKIEGNPVERYRALMGPDVDPRAIDWHAYEEWTSGRAKADETAA